MKATIIMSTLPQSVAQAVGKQIPRRPSLLAFLFFALLATKTFAQIASVEIDGFQIRPVSIGGVTHYDFVPTVGGSDCSPAQFRQHLFSWVIGRTDRSVDAIPRREFHSATPISVKLRVTGIKEYVDPDRTPADQPDPDPTNNYYRELPPSLWATKTISEQTFTPSMTTPAPNSSLPSLALEVPNHAPIPGEPYSYLLVLRNYTTCPQNVRATLTADLNGSPLAVVRDITGPPATCSPNDANCGQLRLTMAAGTRFTIPFTVRIPGGRESIGARINFNATSDFAPERDVCQDTTLRAFNSQFVARAVDPNYKWCQNGSNFIPGNRVEFAIRFKNEGNLEVHSVVITDTLDSRLVGASAQPVSVEVNGSFPPERAEGLDPTFWTFSRLPGNVVQFLLTLSPSNPLEPLDSGVVVFSVPIAADFHSLPSDEVEQVPGKCASLVTIPNRAVTMFPEEGIGYGVDCRPPVRVIVEDPKCGQRCEPCCPRYLCLVLGGLSAALLIVIGALLRRLRKVQASSK